MTGGREDTPFPWALASAAGVVLLGSGMLLLANVAHIENCFLCGFRFPLAPYRSRVPITEVACN